MDFQNTDGHLPYEASLAGKVVVITGASSGFGRGAALEFARHDARVVIAARRRDMLAELAIEMRQAGGEVEFITTDVSDESQVKELCEFAVARFGRIDVWVNNAGVGAIGPFEQIPVAEHAQVIATNLLGTMYGSWHAYHQFVRQGEGTLVNISSVLGKISEPYYTSYTASKHGVLGLSISLRQEISQNEAVKDKVHVCVILPTAHDTPFFDHAANYTGHDLQQGEHAHAPSEVVDAIIRMARNPKEEQIVGDGYLRFLEQRFMPFVLEHQMARRMHDGIEKAPNAPFRSLAESP